MRVLHITHNIHSGGAATYVRRLLHSQIRKGVEPSLLVGSPSNLFNGEILVRPGGIHNSKVLQAKVANGLDRMIGNLESTPYPTHKSFNFFGALNHDDINSSEVDIVHLHWINHGLISIRQLSKVRKPIVWSALDMWPFSGGEHYVTDQNMPRFVEGYKKTNRSPGSFGIDLERIAFNFKLKMKYKRILFVFPSDWLKQICESSSFGSDFNAIVLPPPIDTNFFKPLNDRSSSYLHDERMLTFGFGGGLSARKGWGETKQLFLDLVRRGRKIRLVHFGGSAGDGDLSNFPNYKFVGNLAPDSSQLVQLLNELDVLLFASTQEAFGLLAQEAQSCGTPVLARRGTGSEATLEPNQTGWLFTRHDELIEVFEYLLTMNPRERLVFRRQARKRAETIWSYEKVSRQFTDAYSDWITG
jgi:glycosyltransferase involved in cell wall biosynthesis